MNRPHIQNPLTSISHKIIFIFILTLAAVVALFYFYNNFVTYQSLKQTELQRLEEIMTLANADFKTALEFENQEAMEETANKLLKLENVLEIRVTSGTYVFDSHRKDAMHLECSSDHYDSPALLEGPVPYFEQHRTIGAGATLCIIYSALPFVKQIEDYNYFTLSFSLVLLGLSIPVWLLIKRFFHPLKELADTFRSIDFNHFAPIAVPHVKNNDERQIIIESTREMFLKLEHYITLLQRNEQELKTFNEKLEYQVDLKTKELRELNMHLSERITAQVETIRRQDHALMRQARFASMGEMMSNIAHQWRQPLNAIAIRVQGIGIAYKFGELDQHNLDENITLSMELIQNLSETINAFRDFFNPNEEKEPFFIKNALQDALAIIGEALQEHKITVVSDIDENLEAYGFPNEFSQLLINLINNSKDAFEKNGTEERTIWLNSSQGKTQTELIVEDNGGGIDETIMEKIFDPYFTTKFKASGTGVGLYMAKMVLEQHMNGSITARNSDKGARFTITLRK